MFLSLRAALNIFLASKWNQHPCFQKLTQNQHFELFRPEIGVSDKAYALHEMNIFLAAVRRWREIHSLSYLDLKSMF